MTSTSIRSCRRAAWSPPVKYSGVDSTGCSSSSTKSWWRREDGDGVMSLGGTGAGDQNAASADPESGRVGEAGLPPGWVETTIGQIATVVRGVTYKKEEVRDGAAGGFLPLLRATNISDELSLDECVFVPEHRLSRNQ